MLFRSVLGGSVRVVVGTGEDVQLPLPLHCCYGGGTTSARLQSEARWTGTSNNQEHFYLQSIRMTIRTHLVSPSYGHFGNLLGSTRCFKAQSISSAPISNWFVSVDARCRRRASRTSTTSCSSLGYKTVLKTLRNSKGTDQLSALRFVFSGPIWHL